MPALTDPQYIEILKGFGFGLDTTDDALKTQGRAVTYETVDDEVKELTFKDDSFPLIRFYAGQSKETGSDEFQWNQRTSIGGGTYDSWSTNELGAVERTSSINRLTERVAYLTEAYGTLDTLTMQKNTMAVARDELRPAVWRMDRTKSFGFWEANSIFSPRQFNGFESWVNRNGPSHAFDMASADFGGLDANGFTNVNMLQKAFVRAGKLMNNLKNGQGKLTRVYMNRSSGAQIDENYNSGLVTSFVELSNLSNGTKYAGQLIGGFSNRFGAENNATAILTDQYIREDEDLRVYEIEAAAVPDAIQPTATFRPATVTATGGVASLAEQTRFNAAFAGAMHYYVEGVNERGLPSLAFTVTPITIAVGTLDKVTLAIAASGSNQETSYKIYRSFPGATPGDKTKARLVTQVAKDASGTTSFVDLNKFMPGGAKAYGFDDTVPAAEYIQIKHTIKNYSVELPRSITAMARKPFGFADSMGMAMPYHRRAVKFYNLFPANGLWSPTKGQRDVDWN